MLPVSNMRESANTFGGRRSCEWSSESSEAKPKMGGDKPQPYGTATVLIPGLPRQNLSGKLLKGNPIAGSDGP
jgi:hypothetical protein